MNDYEPRHLLKFEGNPELQLHYRSLIYNLHRGDVKTDQNRCLICNAVISTKEGARFKSHQRMTRNIQKLMTKKSRKIPLSQMERFKLNKFMENSQQMVVKCSECTFINKKPTISRRDLIKLKSKLISEVEEAAAKEKMEEAREERMEIAGPQIVTEVLNDKAEGDEDEKAIEPNIEKSNEKEPVTKEKKKKKKRKKTKDFISTLLQQKASEKKKAKKKKNSSSTPVSLRDFVLSETQDTPSPSHIDVFHKAIHSNNTSYEQSPVCTDSTTADRHQQSTTKSSSKKPKKKSKSDKKKELRNSLFFETSRRDDSKTKMTTSTTPVSTKQSPSTNQTPSASSSKKRKKKIIQKELRKYLTEVPQLQEKSSSLKDFLISL